MSKLNRFYQCTTNIEGDWMNESLRVEFDDVIEFSIYREGTPNGNVLLSRTDAKDLMDRIFSWLSYEKR